MNSINLTNIKTNVPKAILPKWYRIIIVKVLSIGFYKGFPTGPFEKYHIELTLATAKFIVA